MGFFDKLGEGLRKTRNNIFGAISEMVNAGEITDELYDELEEQLILADTGADIAAKLVEELRGEVRRNFIKTGSGALEALKEIIFKMVNSDTEMHMDGMPAVILVIGVNGVGKTTSIAKLAHLYKEEGRRVMLAAGDTFRAAASEQLCVWAERADVPVIKHAEGADPAAVIFDAVSAAASRGYDIVICDTAGRLHIDEEQRAIQGADAATRAFLLADFHVCLAENMGHRLLADTLRDLTARTTLAATLYQSDHSAEQSCADHASIVAALERGDTAQARALMLAHIGQVEEALETTPPPPEAAPGERLRATLSPVQR